MVKGNVMMSDCQVPSFNLLFTSAYVSSFFISLLREIIIYITLPKGVRFIFCLTLYNYSSPRIASCVISLIIRNIVRAKTNPIYILVSPITP